MKGKIDNTDTSLIDSPHEMRRQLEFSLQSILLYIQLRSRGKGLRVMKDDAILDGSGKPTQFQMLQHFYTTQLR